MAHDIFSTRCNKGLTGMALPFIWIQLAPNETCPQASVRFTTLRALIVRSRFLLQVELGYIELQKEMLL